MPRNTETVEIEGVKYTIRQVGGFDGLRLKAMVLKQISEPVARLIASATSLGDLLELDFQGEKFKHLLAEAIPAIGDNLSPDYLVVMARLMIFGNVKAQILGAEVDIEDEATYAAAIAQGSPLHDVQLLMKCLAVNLGPIFADRPMTQAETAGRQQLTP